MNFSFLWMRCTTPVELCRTNGSYNTASFYLASFYIKRVWTLCTVIPGTWVKNAPNSASNLSPSLLFAFMCIRVGVKLDPLVWGNPAALCKTCRRLIWLYDLVLQVTHVCNNSVGSSTRLFVLSLLSCSFIKNTGSVIRFKVLYRCSASFSLGH